jgi:hypothetical protein
MLIRHAGAAPKIDAGAYVAPNAVVCGNVTIGPGCRIMYGAQIIAESGSISIGRECIVMENAVLRSSARAIHSTSATIASSDPRHTSWAAPWRTKSSLPRGRPSSIQPILAEAAKCASTGLCISRATCLPAAQFRLGGWRSAILHNCCHLASTSASGRFRSP